MRTQTKNLTVTAMMLALCIVAQCFKNLSAAYITGPVVNLAIIICTLYCGLSYGTILAVITPITAFFITGSPLIAACPLILPCIMIGNEVMAAAAWLVRGRKREELLLPVSLIAASFVKAGVMSLLIISFVIPVFGTALNENQRAMAKTAYSTTQLIAALIGAILTCIIWRILKAAIKHNK